MIALIKNRILFAIFSLIFAAAIGYISAERFLRMHEAPALYPSPALTKTVLLSQYNQHLKGTRGDTDVYFFNSDSTGGTLLILGGTHPNEPAAFLTACLIMEHIRAVQGQVIIIPRANNSAFTHNDPQEGQPQTFMIAGEKRTRTFRFGSRITNSIDQWPDPEIYLHYPSGQKLAGNETRNLNRAYPGRADGNLTERMAYAIVQLIKTEQVDLAFDLHEAAPEYPVVNAIVASERSQMVATEAAMELQFEGLLYSMEPSPYNFHGLSHREWQDYTDTYPVLLETANPIQGRLRGKTDTDLLLSGIDPMYVKAAELGELHVPYDSSGISIEVRVGRHLSAIKTFVEVFSRNDSRKAIRMDNIPGYGEITGRGIEHYF